MSASGAKAYPANIAAEFTGGTADKRRRLIRALFSSDSLPTYTLTDAGSNVYTLAIPFGAGLASYNQFTYKFTLYPGVSPNGKMVIYHHGHDQTAVIGAARGVSNGAGEIATVLRQFRDQGYAVLEGSMLHTLAYNSAITTTTQPFSGSQTHNDMYKVMGVEAMQYHFYGVLAAINTFAGTYDIATMGKSGGGWIAMWAAALDPRVKMSFPISGVGAHAEWRANVTTNYYPNLDGESLFPELLEIASDLDLWAMGANNGHQMQFYNSNDPITYLAGDNVGQFNTILGSNLTTSVMAGSPYHYIDDAQVYTGLIAYPDFAAIRAKLETM